MTRIQKCLLKSTCKIVRKQLITCRINKIKKTTLPTNMPTLLKMYVYKKLCVEYINSEFSNFISFFYWSNPCHGFEIPSHLFRSLFSVLLKRPAGELLSFLYRYTNICRSMLVFFFIYPYLLTSLKAKTHFHEIDLLSQQS